MTTYNLVKFLLRAFILLLKQGFEI